MKLRFELLSVLNKYRAHRIPASEEISQDIEFISKFDDKDYIARVLFQEISSAADEFENVCAMFLLEVVDNKTFEKKAIEFLKKTDIPDKKKFLIVSLIKQKGIAFDYDDIENYIQAPENYSKKGIKDFLGNIIFDPEVQIDLLDFYLNVTPEDKYALLDNLEENLPDENVAAAFSCLAQLELDKKEFDFIADALIKSASPYALSGLRHLFKVQGIDFRTLQKIRKAIKTIEDNNPDFQGDEIIQNSKVFEAYMSFVDGNSNFSLGFARKIEKKGAEDNIACFFCVISIPDGITSCMGFNNISKDNYASIKGRLFSDMPPVKISPMALKSLLLHYEGKNKKTKTKIPYELSVWKKLLLDTKTINYDLSEYINSCLDTTNLDKDKVKKLITSKVTETWYRLYGQDERIDKIIEEIEEKHLVEYEEIEPVVSRSIEENFLKDDKFMTELKDKLLLQAYAANFARLKMTSLVAYSLCFKNPYTGMFVQSIIERSIWQHFRCLLSEDYRNNVFRKSKTKFSKDELELIMSQIEEKWS